MIWRVPTPRRPEVTSDRARRVLEWADVAFYLFSLGMIAAILVAAVLIYGPAAKGLLP
jgi:hypothetical protein